MSVDIDKILKENRERVRIQQYEDTYGGDWSDYVPADKAGEIYYNNIGVQNAYTTKNSGNAYLTKKADASKPKSINIQSSSQDVLQQNEINQKNDLDSDETAASKELGKVEGSNTTVNVGRPINNQSNPLHFYPSYNYIITLSCASRERINTGQGREIVIFKSGGKGKQGDGPLSVDYYVDNLVIRNTVSPTTVAGTGTAYQIAFEVTEPFGVSFIDALIKASRDLGYQNHLKAVFLLKVEFKGFDDAGEPSGDIPFSTREIPIHLYQADMSVQAGVTVYDVQAIPASYLALTALHQTTLETIRCSGETVGDVLLSFFEEYNKTLQKNVQSKKLDQLDNFELSVEDSMADILKSPIGYDAKSSSSNKIMFSNGEAPPPVQSFRGVTIAKGTGIQTLIDRYGSEALAKTFMGKDFPEFSFENFGKDENLESAGRALAPGALLTKAIATARLAARANKYPPNNGGGGYALATTGGDNFINPLNDVPETTAERLYMSQGFPGGGQSKKPKT